MASSWWSVVLMNHTSVGSAYSRATRDGSGSIGRIAIDAGDLGNGTLVTIPDWDTWDEGLWTPEQRLLLEQGLAPRHAYVTMGVLLSFIVIFGLVANATILYVFSRFKRLRTPANVFIINLTACDFFSCLIHPMAIYSAFRGRWSFGKTGCNFYATCIGFFGLNSIVTLSAIACERYIVITSSTCRPAVGKWRITRCQAQKACFCIWLHCAALVAPPWLLGWSSYQPEGILVTCSWDYSSRTLSNRLYYVYLLVLGFVLPVSILTFCYAAIFRFIVRSSKEMTRLIMTSDGKSSFSKTTMSFRKRRRQTDVRTALIILSLALLCFTAWTPYAIVSLIGQFGPLDENDEDGMLEMSPLTTSIPAFLAKTAILFDPLVYGFSHPQFRSSVRQILNQYSMESSNNGAMRGGKHKNHNGTTFMMVTAGVRNASQRQSQSAASNSGDASWTNNRMSDMKKQQQPTSPGRPLTNGSTRRNMGLGTAASGIWVQPKRAVSLGTVMWRKKIGNNIKMSAMTSAQYSGDKVNRSASTSAFIKANSCVAKPSSACPRQPQISNNGNSNGSSDGGDAFYVLRGQTRSSCQEPWAGKQCDMVQFLSGPRLASRVTYKDVKPSSGYCHRQQQQQHLSLYPDIHRDQRQEQQLQQQQLERDSVRSDQQRCKLSRRSSEPHLARAGYNGSLSTSPELECEEHRARKRRDYVRSVLFSSASRLVSSRRPSASGKPILMVISVPLANKRRDSSASGSSFSSHVSNSSTTTSSSSSNSSNNTTTNESFPLSPSCRPSASSFSVPTIASGVRHSNNRVSESMPVANSLEWSRRQTRSTGDAPSAAGISRPSSVDVTAATAALNDLAQKCAECPKEKQRQQNLEQSSIRDCPAPAGRVRFAYRPLSQPAARQPGNGESGLDGDSVSAMHSSRLDSTSCPSVSCDDDRRILNCDTSSPACLS